MQIGAWSYMKITYAMPEEAVIEEKYAKAQKINTEIKNSNLKIQQVQKDNLQIVSFFTMLAQHKPKNLMLNNVSIDEKSIKLQGEGIDLNSVNEFAQELKTERYSNAHIEQIGNKDRHFSFVIVMKAKAAAKKENKPQKNVTGGKETNV